MDKVQGYYLRDFIAAMLVLLEHDAAYATADYCGVFSATGGNLPIPFWIQISNIRMQM